MEVDLIIQQVRDGRSSSACEGVSVLGGQKTSRFLISFRAPEFRAPEESGLPQPAERPRAGEPSR